MSSKSKSKVEDEPGFAGGGRASEAVLGVDPVSDLVVMSRCRWRRQGKHESGQRGTRGSIGR
jgi:hypothetical protein